MFFSRKDKNKDLDSIRDEVVEDEEMPAPPRVEPIREPVHQRYEPSYERYEKGNYEPKVHNYAPRKEFREQRAPGETAAPLFVKVDKYRELITSIHELKLYLGATKQVFGLFTDIESVRAEALNVLRATVQRLERTIVEMDSELLRPRGVTVTPDREEVAEVTHIENSMNDLHKQLQELKRELGDLK